MAADNKWEGVMLRKNVSYEGKRTKNLVKVKKFYDAEYKVIDFDIDDHEVVRDGKSVTLQLLAQVYIEHKGHRVKVGSGFTQEQRLQYMDGSIIGKIITVQYFEETKNDKGGISLRFPTVKIIHGGKREM
jgi:DNA ligase-1